MRKKLEQKILEALSFHEWKRTKHLHEETGVPFHRLYVALHKFEIEGFVDKRWADLSTEELRRRSGNGAHEYRLTTSGIRRREEVTTPGFGGELAHQT